MEGLECSEGLGVSRGNCRSLHHIWELLVA